MSYVTTRAAYGGTLTLLHEGDAPNTPTAAPVQPAPVTVTPDDTAPAPRTLDTVRAEQRDLLARVRRTIGDCSPACGCRGRNPETPDRRATPRTPNTDRRLA